MKKLMFVAVFGLALGGCATTDKPAAPAGNAAADAEYAKLVAEAEQEIKLAAKAGFLWNNTEKFMKEAEDAKKKGDMDKATKNVKKAIKEAQLAQKQAKDQAKPHVALDDFQLSSKK